MDEIRQRRKQLYRVDSSMRNEKPHEIVTVHISPEFYKKIKEYCKQEGEYSTKLMGSFLEKYFFDERLKEDSF